MPFIPGRASNTLTVNTTPVSPLITDVYIRADAVTGAININLPAAVSGYIGASIEIKKVDVTSNLVTIIPNTTDTIDGQAGIIIKLPQDAYKLFIVATGKWEII